MRKYIAEFIGTFVLVAFGCGSAVAANSIFISMGSPLPIAFTTLLIAFAFGLSIVAMAYSIGNVSGCHINPAVSLGALIAGRMNVKDFVGYLIAQFAGAAVAALFLMVLFGGRDALGANGYGTSSAVGISMAGAIGLEILMTFVFVLVVLGATSKEEFSPVAGLVIGLSLTLIHIFGIPFTGTSVNPARSFGPAIVSGGDALSQLPVFILAPLVGGALAALVFRFLMEEPAAEKEYAEVEQPAEAEPVVTAAAAAEEVLETAGAEFEESYEAGTGEENGSEELAHDDESVSAEFEETYELMNGTKLSEEEAAEETFADEAMTEAAEPEEAVEEAAEETAEEPAEAAAPEASEEPAEAEEAAEMTEEPSEETAEEPAEESAEEEAAEEPEDAEDKKEEDRREGKQGGKHKRQGGRRRKSSKHNK